MSAFVIDTMVPIVANGQSDQADPDCVIACINEIAEIQAQGQVLLDDQLLILHEYMGNLSMSGQPGAGDFFMKWVWIRQADEQHCQQVHITPCAEDPTNFVEFPQDARLLHFDHSDREFVAVALNSGCDPQIVNAVDSDWSEHSLALSEAGVRIKFLCPQHVCPRR